jgi:TolB-like protein/Tfp pilus assembly protein PilF
MSFFGELKRRNVFRVGIAYLIASWLTLQVVDVVAPILELPNWISRSILLFLAVGFVVSVILAWAYELTPEGVKREKDVDRSRSITPETGRKLDFMIIGVLAIALAFFALDRFVWHEHASESVAELAELGKSIAVLPFDNRSADESDAYFVDGIHDDILTQLHKLSGIDKVISRTTMDRYRDTGLSIPQIAEELGVATILEGGVQRAGNRVRVTVQLINASNDEHLWAENYDRELTTTNVFEIQSEISAAIARELRAALTEDEAVDLAVRPTENLAAYDAYLLGKHTMRDRAPNTLERAKQYFEEAISLDPEFALAYVGLADVINLANVYGMVGGGSALTTQRSIDALETAQVAAKRALEINDRLGEAYASLGYSQWQLGAFLGYGEESLRTADEYYRKALELSPNYADLYRWYAQVLWMHALRRPQEALAMAERAVALDPMFAVNHTVLGFAYDVNGRGDETIESFERSLQISPGFQLSIIETADLQARHGDHAAAIKTSLNALVRFPQNAQFAATIALSYRDLGDQDRFIEWTERARELGGRFRVSALDVVIALDEGDNETAAQLLEDTLADWIACRFCINFLAHNYVRNEQPELLLQFLGRYAGEMLNPDAPEVTPQTASLTAPAVWALKETGADDLASRIVEAGLEVARNNPRRAGFDYGVNIADVELHAVQGNYRFALDALASAVDEGYRSTDWIDRSPFIDSIRSDPDFVAAMEIIRADFAAQRAELDELERNGDLPTSSQ